MGASPLTLTQWIKGGEGATEIAVFDELRSPCEMAGHLIRGGDQGAVEWRIFAAARAGAYWVMGAHRLEPEGRR